MSGENESKRSAQVVVQLGRLPDCWPDSAVFFANLDCIFFGDPLKTEELVANVMGFSGYGARMLPVLGLLFRGSENALLLGEEPDADLSVFFRDVLGLRLPEVLVHHLPPTCGLRTLGLDAVILHRLRASRAPFLDGYVTDPYLEELAAELGKRTVNSHRQCVLANDKIGLNRYLAAASLPLFDGGEATAGELRTELERLALLGYRRAAVRAALGASGFGMQVIDLETGASRGLSASLHGEERLLVQGWVEEGRLGCSELASPSVQFFCGAEERVSLYDFTDQLLSNNSVHEGNMAPPLSMALEETVRTEIVRQATLVSAWIASLGYRGPGSIDFLVWRQEGGTRVQVCEVNARVTGATYPSLLALRCNPGGAWLMRNMVFGPCMNVRQFLGFLAERELLFEARSQHGIIPVNVIRAADGQIVKCQLLFLAETTQRCLRLMEEFPAILPSSCRFERD